MAANCITQHTQGGVHMMRVVPPMIVFLITSFVLTMHGQQVPRVGLNHVYAVVDDDTAEAIKTSNALKEFATFEVKTVAPGDGRRWTGRYLVGKQTYLELFALEDLKE